MKKLSFYQRVNAQAANPVNFLLHLIGLIGGAYYLWNQNWQWAAAFGLFLPFIGGVYAWYTEKGKNVKMGMVRELCLSHAEPVNTVLHLIGLILAVMGFWNRDYLLLGGAVIAVSLGHLFGAALMTEVMPKMIKRLTVLDLMLMKYSSLLFGLLVGAYAMPFVLDFQWWIVGLMVVLGARPFAHFFMNE